MSRWIGTVGDEWIITSHSGVEWWDSMPYESVDLLVHSSLCDILLVMLVMVFLLNECFMSRWIRAIWNEWIVTFYSSVEWRKSMPDESVDFFIHTSLGNIFFVVLLLTESDWRSILSLWIRAIWNECLTTSLPLINWGSVFLDETMNFLIHFSLSNIWFIVMFVMMLLLVKGCRTLKGRW